MKESFAHKGRHKTEPTKENFFCVVLMMLCTTELQEPCDDRHNTFDVIFN